jgi:hypothetical protein
MEGTVLNPALFDALTSIFGKVRLTSEGENARWAWDRKNSIRVVAMWSAASEL